MIQARGFGPLLTLGISALVFTVTATRAFASDAANWLTLYSYPPMKFLNWFSPSTLLSDTLGNTVDAVIGSGGSAKSVMGHAAVQVSCTDTQGRRQEFWSGMSGQNSFSEDWQNLMNRKIGMEILFRGYRDGVIQGENIEKQKIVNYAGGVQREPRFLRVEISPRQCSFLAAMHGEFSRRSYRAGIPYKEWFKRADHDLLFYGMEVEDPLKNYLDFRGGNKQAKLGGGCTGYATALVRSTGKWHASFEKFWKRSFDVSEKLFGTPQRPVSIRDVLDAHQWTYPHWENRSGFLYDPEFIWRFLGKALDCHQEKSAACPLEVTRWIEDNRNQLSSDEKITLEGVREKLEQIGSPKNPIYVRRQYKVKRTLHGITVRGISPSPHPY